MKIILTLFLVFIFCSCKNKNCLEEINGFDSSGFIAHFTHSLTLQELKKFNPSIKTNDIMTIDRNLTSSTPILQYAPNEEYDPRLKSRAFQIIDQVMRYSSVKMYDIKNYDAIGRIVHSFHMEQIWNKILTEYKKIDSVNPNRCRCYKESQKNIWNKLRIMALQMREPELMYKVNNKQGYRVGYRVSYRFGLNAQNMNRVKSTLPKILGYNDWLIWKEELLRPHNKKAIKVGAEYLKCMLN